jgi:hypothetical protein
MIYVKTFYAIFFCGFVAKGKPGSSSYFNLKVDASPSLARVIILRPVKYPSTIPPVPYRFGVLTNNKLDQVLRWVASY